MEHKYLKKETHSFGDQPRIAIVGKPNVGKSSLFNMLLGRRKSLVASTAGVTRDIVHGTLDLEDSNAEVLLLDTGGISNHIKHDFIDETILFAHQELKKAHVVLFVIDFQTGITEDDFAILQKIRKEHMDHTILVINKVDNDDMEEEAFEYYSLGFKEVSFVSCAHKRGMGELRSKIETLLSECTEGMSVSAKLDAPLQDMKEAFPDETLEIQDIQDIQDMKEPLPKETLEIPAINCVLLGKPNVGKSSFFNMVIGRQRSIVSPVAGTTRDVIGETFGYKNRTINIVDMAGFRRRNRIVEFIEKESIKKALWAIRQQDIILILIDGADKVSEQDKKLIELAMKEKKAMVIGLNKWDLIDDVQEQKMLLERFEHQLQLAAFVPIVPFSVKTGKNVQHLLDTLVSVHNNYSQKISPRDITLFLQQVIKEKPPFSKLGLLKLYYGVQVGSTPPHFDLFVNNPKLVNEAYKKFLMKSIYKNYKLLGVPVFLNFKPRH